MLRNSKKTKASLFPDASTGTAPVIAPRWVRPKVAAYLLGTTQGTLAKWRHEGRGPAYHIPPGIRSVLYDLTELDRFVQAGRIETTGGAL